MANIHYSLIHAVVVIRLYLHLLVWILERKTRLRIRTIVSTTFTIKVTSKTREAIFEMIATWALNR